MSEPFKVGDKAEYVGKSVTIAGGPFTGYSEWYAVKGEDGKEHPAAASGLTSVPAFVVGDEVIYAYGGGGKLVAGPFKSEHHDTPIWVVEKPNGTHMTPTENSLTKVEPSKPDPIKVGDWVRVVRDDPHTRAGEFVGKVGTVVGLRGTGSLPYDVAFAVDQDTPHRRWNVTEVERVDEPAPADDTVTHDGVTYELGADYRDKDGDTWTFLRVDDEIRGDFGYNRRDYIGAGSQTLASAVSEYGPFTKI